MIDKNLYDHFYILRGNAQPYAMRCSPIHKSENEETSQYMSSEFIKNLPTEYYHASGRRLDAGRTSIKTFIISEKIKKLLEKEGVTGLGFIPVTLKLKSGEIRRDYYIMIITSWVKSSKTYNPEVWYIETIGSLKWHNVGWFFDVDGWDGSDVFIVPGSVTICVTEKAKKVFSKFSSGFDIFCCRTYQWVTSEPFENNTDKKHITEAEKINGYSMEIEFGRTHIDDFCVGDVIEHQAFGVGKILEIKDERPWFGHKKIKIHLEKPCFLKNDIFLDTDVSGITKIISHAEGDK